MYSIVVVFSFDCADNIIITIIKYDIDVDIFVDLFLRCFDVRSNICMAFLRGAARRGLENIKYTNEARQE